MSDLLSTCAEREDAPKPAKEAAKPKAAPKVARGFKTLKNVTVGGVIADAVNSVTLLDKNGKVYYVIEAEVIGGIPVLKCTKRNVVKYKRPDTSGARLNKNVISKFA